MLWCAVFLVIVVCLMVVVWLSIANNVILHVVLFPVFILGIQYGMKVIHRMLAIKFERLVSQGQGTHNESRMMNR